MVAMPSALVPTSSSSARAALPLEARTSASPTPRVVGTAEKMVRPGGGGGRWDGGDRGRGIEVVGSLSWVRGPNVQH